MGTKYLRSPILPSGEEAGTVLAGLTTNRGAFPDPNNAQQLYRYISGNLNSAAGDPQCNTGDPAITHLCFINNVPSDTRTFQSSGPLNLPRAARRRSWWRTSSPRRCRPESAPRSRAR